jgi:hypothetical protein
MLRIASELPKGDPTRRKLLASLKGSIPDNWASDYLYWFDRSILSAVGQDMDDDVGSLVNDLHLAISGNTGYPRSARKQIGDAIKDFTRKVSRAMADWDKQQKAMGVEFRE